MTDLEQCGFTPLHKAASAGFPVIVESLVAHGADPGVRCKVVQLGICVLLSHYTVGGQSFGKLPLHYAVENARERSVAILYDAKPSTVVESDLVRQPFETLRQALM